MFYRIKTRSKKWYKRVLYHFIDLSLINAFILRKEVNGKLPLYEFKVTVASALMYSEILPDPQGRAALLLAAPPPPAAPSLNITTPHPDDASEAGRHQPLAGGGQGGRQAAKVLQDEGLQPAVCLSVQQM